MEKREIKFRAWNLVTKTMIDLKKITPLALNIDQDGLFLPFSDDWPLMQFTGLKDKNGKEIYEGDVIWCTTHAYLTSEYVVKYDKYRFIGVSNESDEFGPFTLNLYINDRNPVLEIIGNIYESTTLPTPQHGKENK